MDVIWTIFLFCVGACVGSFLNVVIYRMPRGESIVFPGSHCPSCGRPIRWYDNIPLLSWLVLAGRCRDCKARISPRYILVEAITALLVGGLFVWLYLLRVRPGAGAFENTWPMYLANAALLCGLLASALVDIDHWIVPLEVCWVVSLVGVVCAAAAPPPEAFLTRVSAGTGALALGGAIGLGLSLILMHYGLIQRSFLDAEDRPIAGDEKAPPAEAAPSPARPAPVSVAFTKAHGVSPRAEVMRELVFLAPPIFLALACWMVATKVPSAAEAWRRLAGETAGAAVNPHVRALLAAVFGYLVGGMWIWGMRIFGTLAFGKEAMGMGDVHILAAVGAVCGWTVPSIAFFLSAFLALAWAISLFVSRRQRELPYGPWLAAGSLVTLLFYDRLVTFLRPYYAVFG